jgi:hypothetical protein
MSRMIGENVDGPNDLLDQYKEYEYILNIDKKKLINDIFKVPKPPAEGEEPTGETMKLALAEIREQVLHYQKAHYEIMTLSEDDVHYKIFTVKTKKLKEDLGSKAQYWVDQILEATYNYCTETVATVLKTYNEMQNNIMHEPQNERELNATRDYCAKAPAQDEAL